MRLAILGHFPVDGPPQGGVQSVIANLSAALARRGDVELHLIQHRRGIPAGTVAGQGYLMHNLAAREHRLLPNAARTGSLVASLLAEIQPDAISSHQPEYALPALATGIPTLHTIHGFPAQEFWSRRGLFVRAATLWEAWQERQTLGRARHLVAISDHVVASYRHRTAARFHRIDNPIAPLFFEESPRPEPGRVLLVGNLNPRKGIDLAIAAVARARPAAPRLILEIAGATTDPVYARQVHEQAAALGDAVRFLGPLSQAEVKAALGRAQLLLLTSRMEHTPMIVAEAMAAGRPVVATSVGAVAGMVADGRTGYLARPEDPEHLADLLATMLSSPDTLSHMAALAAELARQRYHPDAVAEQYLQALQATMLA